MYIVGKDSGMDIFDMSQKLKFFRYPHGENVQKVDDFPLPFTGL